MKDYLIDTHAHIDMLEQPLSQTLQEMEVFGVRKAIIPSVEEKFLDTISNIVSENANLFGMVGIFPSEAKTYNSEIESKMQEIAKKNPKIVAVGEIGLDYYWDKSFNDIQKDVFDRQIKMANNLNLPIVVHDREAHKDCFDILKENNPQNGVLFHCFSGSIEFMRECVREGWYIAIGGVVTFKNAVKLKDVAKEVPLDKLVIETDSPYLTPVPYRGQPNKPAYVKFVAQEIAELREMPIEELMEITTINAERFFRI